MSFVTPPVGEPFEEMNPVALDYYRREPGFTVRDTAEDDRPGKSATKAEWLDYARTRGFDSEDDSVTKAELIAEYGAE